MWGRAGGRTRKPPPEPRGLTCGGAQEDALLLQLVNQQGGPRNWTSVAASLASARVCVGGGEEPSLAS